MRFVVYGAGAVGGVVGFRLFEAGHDVVLVARGAHHDAIAQRGLRLETDHGSAILAVPVVDHPARIDWRAGDVVLLGMKTQDTAAALDALAAVAPAETPVVCLQNGVENERLALRRFSNVYGVCVMCPTGHLEPGVVLAFSTPVTGLLDLGRYPQGVDAIAEEIGAALTEATFESVPRADIMAWKYTKLLLNLANAPQALCGIEADIAEIARAARTEGEATLAAAGIAHVSAAEDAERRADRLSIRAGADRRQGGSTWQSLRRGVGSAETDYLNGEIVLLGRLHGAPTPVNHALQQLVAEAVRSNSHPGDLAPDAILERITSAGGSLGFTP